MAASWQLLLGGQPADPDLTTLIAAVEVEESMDLPGAVQIVVPVSRSSTGDFTYVSDPRFAPLASVAVVATAVQGPMKDVATNAYAYTQGRRQAQAANLADPAATNIGMLPTPF